MAAGIDPIRFWSMTIDEISCVIYGLHQRMKWEARQTYLIAQSFAGKDYPPPEKVFPGLLDPPPQEVQAIPAWQIIKDRIMAHSEDYKRNRGEKT